MEYIQNQFMVNSDNLANEIDHITVNQSKAECVFKNGSYIKVVTAADSARGNRANILVIDEYRLVSEDMANDVLRKFLSDERHPMYRDLPEYADFSEPNKHVYLSSAWYRDHWSFSKVYDYYDQMLRGEKYFVCGLPYQLAIKDGLYRPGQALEEMRESRFNEAKWRREMECEFTSTTEDSFFNMEAINRNRKLKNAMVPASVSTRLPGKDTIIPNKTQDEIRILSADIALMKSTRNKENDATAIFINQLVPNSNGRFYSNIVYTENHEGETTQTQALRLRRLYEEYAIDYIVIDGKGAGAGIVDLLLDDVYDPDTGDTYAALSCYNNPEIAARCTSANAEKALWVINNQTAKFNSECAFTLREGFRSGKIRLLIGEDEAKANFIGQRGWGALNPIEKEAFLSPYVETTQLVDELINLKYEDTMNGVKVYEKSGYRKDRYSSLSYNYWVACQLEEQARSKKRSDINIDDLLKCQRPPKIKQRR